MSDFSIYFSRIPLMRQIHFMVLSLYSARFYLDVVKKWHGFASQYLLILIFIASIPLAIKVNHDFNHLYESKLRYTMEHIPLIYVQSGQISCDEPMPFLVKDAEGTVLAMIDTEYFASSLPKEYPSLVVLVTKDRIMIRKPNFAAIFNPGSQQDPLDLLIRSPNSHDNEVFDGKTWLQISQIPLFKEWLNYLLWPIMAFFFFILYSFFTLMMALMAKFLARSIFKLHLTYAEATRVVRAASTLQVFILFYALTYNVHLNAVMSTMVMTLYASYAFLIIKRDRRKMVLR